MISIEGVSKSFDGKLALEDADLAIQPHTTIALLGPSGCGKSTLLRLILGLIRPDQGRIRIEGTAVTEETAQAVRLRIGTVIQDGGLFPHLTVGKNVSIVAEHLGWDREKIRDRVSELLDLTHLPEELLRRYPAQLSGGQRQRVGLMRGLMLDPDLLLLDEPLGALDPITRAHLQVELREIFDALGKTVLLVTHDLAEAAFLGDEIVLMRDGRIVQRGRIEEMIHHPAEPFVAEFIQAQQTPWRALGSRDR